MSTFLAPKQTEIGINSFSKLAQLINSLNSQRPFIVMDHFLAKPPLELNNELLKNCEDLNISFEFFTDYSGEPTTQHIDKALYMAKQHQADCIIAIGGGSALDIGKVLKVLIPNDSLTLFDLYEHFPSHTLPMVAIPTTAGTGSEATKIAVITDTNTNQKINPGNFKLVPDLALLDGKLVESLPSHFTAYTGMDALTHAIEAVLSTKANIITDHFAFKAIDIIAKNIETAYTDGKNLNAREQMLIGSYFAGLAFSNSSTNLAHAGGRALGTEFHIPHGLSVSILLPYVLEFNEGIADDKLVQISDYLTQSYASSTEDLKVDSAKNRVNGLLVKLDIWQNASQYIDPNQLYESIPTLVKNAFDGNGIKTNLKEPEFKDLENIYLSLHKKIQTKFIQS
ncbi:iron-containing alcohol dehydrogenase family protein [uncultured Marinococcus sp.]|uniref:iron-containing alcohol dehydrogenase family protein n=1 Tax=uncultured Marinococcus sp. TaxID=487012 RepID=UPI002630C61D|nr:iron-containing alcohol dehydrogenase [uncultured Marinococcus sp.]